MSRTKNNRKKSIIILLSILVVILIMLVLLSALLDNTKMENNNNENSIDVVINSEAIIKSEKEEELEKLKEMTERSRIEYYVSNFIRDIEEKKFDEAYDVLNNDFKKNYFSTIKDFKEYAEKKFTTMLDIDYVNFERNGQIYVIWLTMTDAINGDKNSGEEMNFVVKENDYNDFELSFSVK